MTYVMFTKRTNYPKLGYIINRLKAKGVACRLNGASWHAPILEVDAAKLDQAWAILGEKIGRYPLDDVRDDLPRFQPFSEEKP